MCKGEGYKVAYRGTYSKLLTNGMIRYYRPGGAPTHDYYVYYVLKEDTYVQEISLSRYDGNENNKYDKKDDYYINEMQVGMDEWNDVLQEYVLLGCDEFIHTGKQWEWVIFPGEYENIRIYDEEVLCVMDESGKYGIIDTEKKQLVECKYTYILGINEETARVIDENGDCYFINLDGKKLFNDVYQDAYDFHENLAAVKQNDKWGFIDRTGKLLIDYQFDDVSYGFSEGYAAVRKGKRWGFIDKNGKTVINYQYDEATRFKEGKAAVMRNTTSGRRWAYINKKNDVIIEYDFYEPTESRTQIVGEFQNGYALVSKDLYCLMNDSGEIILGDDSYFLGGGSYYNSELGLVVAYDYVDEDMKQKKYGFIDICGEIQVPFVFEYISDFEGNLAVVQYEKSGERQVGVICIKK